MRSFLISVILVALQFVATANPTDSTKQHRLKGKSLIAPAALFTAGLLTMDEDDFLNRQHIREEKSEFVTFYNRHLDDYLQYVPAAAVYGLRIAGVKGKNHVVEETFLLLKSELLMSATVYTLKETTNVERPDNSNNNSFPSGHTAQAFVAATFLHKELGHKSVWYSIGGYAIASTVGVMRVLGDHHWASDVFVGAGIGILSTEIVYATHKFKWSNRKKINITGAPMFNRGAHGFSVCIHL